MTPEPFGTVLKRYREAARLSQNKLARLARYDHSYISRLESTSRVPTREAVENICDALDRTNAKMRADLLASAGYYHGQLALILATPLLAQLDTVYEQLGECDRRVIDRLLESALTTAQALRDNAPLIPEGTFYVEAVEKIIDQPAMTPTVEPPKPLDQIDPETRAAILRVREQLKRGV
jgi:transcriptional regulator with XRE-family HTH domain